MTVTGVSAAPARLGTISTTRCLRKPLKPSTLLGVIDDCLSEAEPHRRIVAALGAVAGARFRTAGAAMV
jgi:hypothetical protein